MKKLSEYIWGRISGCKNREPEAGGQPEIRRAGCCDFLFYSDF
jgi:hypothetical protein